MTNTQLDRARRRYEALAALAAVSDDLHVYLRSSGDPHGPRAMDLADIQSDAFASARSLGCTQVSIATAMGLIDGI
jgi:hypothetical protein